MKKRDFIASIRKLFDKEFRAELERDAGLKDVCRALRKKKRELKREMREAIDDESRKRIEKRLDIVVAQQKKALKLRKKYKAKKRA